MSNPMTTSTSQPSGRVSRLELTTSLGYLALLIVLEVMPIQALALTYAAVSTGSTATAFGPLWLIVAALLQFALARWLVKDQALPLFAVSLLIGLETLALFVILSPTAYGAEPGSFFSAQRFVQLQTDAMSNAPRFNGLFSTVPFVVYLGWRGLTLGADPPKLYVMVRRLMISLTVVMLACLSALVAPRATQPTLQGALIALVALDVFAGLAAGSLAPHGGGSEPITEQRSSDSIRWLLSAFGAAAAVVLLAVGIGLVFNISLTRPLLAALGPVGDAINVVINWLALGLAYLLWILIVKPLSSWLFVHSQFYMTAPKQSGSPPSSTTHHVIAAPPAWLVVATSVVVTLVVVAALVAVLYLALKKVLRDTQPDADEERESLDARDLMRKNARSLFSRNARRSPQATSDRLAQGSARWLYRESLRAGAAAGLARRDDETADEYSARLAVSLTDTDAASLAALTQVYDDARYGERAQAPAPEVVTAGRRVASAIARLRAGR